jgi:hypothetical protein
MLANFARTFPRGEDSSPTATACDFSPRSLKNFRIFSSTVLLNGYLVAMVKPARPNSVDSAVTPAWQNFLLRLESLAIRPAARDYYVRWAEPWISSRSNRSADSTTNYVDAWAAPLIWPTGPPWCLHPCTACSLLPP